MCEGTRNESEEMAESEQVVTPWEAHAAEGQAAIDYGKLISKPRQPVCVCVCTNL